MDYLRKALEVQWDDKDKIVKMEFRKLNETEVESISRTYQLQAAKMKAELFSDWKVLKTWSPSEGHTYYLAKTEIETAKQPYLQICYKTPQRRYTRELTLFDCARILRVNIDLGFTQMWERCNFVDNL